MNKCHFPEGSLIFHNKPFTREFIEITLEEIYKARERFTGFIRVSRGEDVQYFLFFLKGDPYAAGEVIRCKPAHFMVKDFFDRINAASEEQMVVSLHETDPVLLKDILIFMQKEPTIKAATNIVNVDDVSKEIQENKSDALIILIKNDTYNFFFFKDGKAVMSHFADADFKDGGDAPVSEQLLLYAYPSDLTNVEALVYRTISTEQAADSIEVSQVDMVRMLYHVSGIRVEDVSEVKEKGEKKKYVLLVIVAGPNKGDTLNVPIPCVIGRKEGEIIIDDMQVSRRHASLKEADGQLFIEDLGSTNGTFVNKEEIKVKEVTEGDIITLGETSLRFDGYGGS